MPFGPDSLIPLLTGGDPADIGFRQGKVVEWDPDNGLASIEVGGGLITNPPWLSTVEALAIQVGDVIGLLRYKSTFFVLGRIETNPGEFVIRNPDGQITIRIARTVAGGGASVTYHPNGTPHVIIGQLTIEATGEVVGQGFVVQQDDGFDLLTIGPTEAGGNPWVRIRDHLGTIIAAGNPEHGLMSRPFIEVPMYSLSSQGAFDHDSDDQGIIFHGALWVTHPYVRMMVRAWCSASTSGTLRFGLFAADGSAVQLGPDIFVSATTADFYDFGWQQLPEETLSDPYSRRRVFVTAERTSGSGLVICQPYMCVKGVQ